MAAIANMITGSGDRSAKKAQAAATARAEEARKAQEAVQRRQQLREDERETDLSAQSASLRRAVAARRRGAGSLKYTGPNTGLKQTFGG